MPFFNDIHVFFTLPTCPTFPPGPPEQQQINLALLKYTMQLNIQLLWYCVGGDVTDLAAIQTGLTTVRVTWTAPPGPPAMYQIMVDAPDVDFDTTATESPYFLITSELGVHSIQVLYTSQHFPNEQAMPVEVTVEGKGEGYRTVLNVMALRT